MRSRDWATIAVILLLAAAYAYVGQADEQSAQRDKIFRNVHA